MFFNSEPINQPINYTLLTYFPAMEIFNSREIKCMKLNTKVIPLPLVILTQPVG